MASGSLLTQLVGDDLHITGTVSLSGDLLSLVGTVEKAASAPVAVDVDRYEDQLVEAIRSGTRVLGGYVKFAAPLVIAGFNKLGNAPGAPPSPAAPGAKIQGLVGKLKAPVAPSTAPVAQPPVQQDRLLPKFAADEQFIADLARALALASAPELRKEAACAFVENLIDSIEHAKVQSTEVGLLAPYKVAFPDTKTRDDFLALFKRPPADEKQAALTQFKQAAARLLACEDGRSAAAAALVQVDRAGRRSGKESGAK